LTDTRRRMVIGSVPCPISESSQRNPASAKVSPPMAISLVLADGHPLILRALEDLFHATKGFNVLAMSPDGEETLRAVRQHRPDVLVLDLRLRLRDGLAVLRAMRIEGLPTRVVVFTEELSSEEALELLRLDVGGVVLKEMAPGFLVQAIQKVHAGERWLERQSFGQAVDKLMRRAAGERQASALLTPRELEIARLVGCGFRNAAIAQRLKICEGTVKMHLHKIYEKLKISSRVELALYTQEKHLV
jgi:two-component system, NarL family, nitrate/nitrite response regulator NarL